MTRAVFSESQFACDRAPSPPIKGSSVAHAIYVDGVGVVGTSQSAVDDAHRRVVKGMHRSGLVPGEEEGRHGGGGLEVLGLCHAPHAVEPIHFVEIRRLGREKSD